MAGIEEPIVGGLVGPVLEVVRKVGGRLAQVWQGIEARMLTVQE